MEAFDAMETSTLDSGTITVMATIVGSWLTLVGLMIFQFHRLDTKFDKKIDTEIGDLDKKIGDLDTKFAGEFKAVHGEFKAVRGELSEVRERLGGVEARLEDHGRRLVELGESSRERGRVLVEVRERLARVEGWLMGPESLSPVPLPPRPPDPADGERRAG